MFLWQQRNYYDLLEVSRDADSQQIMQAKRAQLAAWHPDKHVGTSWHAEAASRTQYILEASDVLLDPFQREAYDLQPVVGSSVAASAVEAFDEPLQNIPHIWKAMAAWMKDEDAGTGFQRSMAYKAGDLLERNRLPSDKQRPHMTGAWAVAVSEGFDPASALVDA